MLGSTDNMYSRQYVTEQLHRLGFPELVEAAVRELPDLVDTEQLANWGMRHGVTKDDLISRMGSSP